MSDRLSLDLRDRLLGRWYGMVEGEPVAMEFGLDGRLSYIVLHGKQRQTILLKYRIEGDHLVTDQLSSQQQEHTGFEFVGRDLVLEFQGKRIHLTR